MQVPEGAEQYAVPLLPAAHTITRLGGGVPAAPDGPAVALLSYSGWVHKPPAAGAPELGEACIAMPPQTCLGCTWAPLPPVNSLLPAALPMCQPVMGCAAKSVAASEMRVAAAQLGMATPDGCWGCQG